MLEHSSFYYLSLTSLCISPPPSLPPSLSQHILQFFVQLLVAIEHIHSQNILHRDLKTQNIMLNKKRTVLKIGDFGISKVLNSKITSAQTVRRQLCWQCKCVYVWGSMSVHGCTCVCWAVYMYIRVM